MRRLHDWTNQRCGPGQPYHRLPGSFNPRVASRGDHGSRVCSLQGSRGAAHQGSGQRMGRQGNPRQSNGSEVHNTRPAPQAADAMSGSASNQARPGWAGAATALGCEVWFRFALTSLTGWQPHFFDRILHQQTSSHCGIQNPRNISSFVLRFRAERNESGRGEAPPEVRSRKSRVRKSGTQVVARHSFVTLAREWLREMDAGEWMKRWGPHCHHWQLVTRLALLRVFMSEFS